MRWLALALCAGVVCGPAGAARSAPATVEITNFAFTPKDLTVEKGATVRWTNHDGEPHTVVSSDDPKAFKSKALDNGDAYSFTFTEPGTYRYFCSVHPHMQGRIVVKDAEPQAGAP